MGLFKKNQHGPQDELEFIGGENRPFAVAEAHKRLRTNVIFSFADKSTCRIIGVTSSLAHEGKSTTAVNLAYDMLQAGKKVLLIDSDMRLSQIAKNLELSTSPGLSNLLVGENNGENLIQHAHTMAELPVITCGDLPPNPSELLSSKRMEVLIETLKKSYQYIVLDLPPISAVTDALVLSKLCDGMIIVVRQDFVDKNILSDTVRQLKMNNSNIIGFVLTCANDSQSYYKGKYKYKKYYGNKYYYGGGKKKQSSQKENQPLQAENAGSGSAEV